MDHIVTTNVACAIPAAQAWEKLRDISLAHHYVPGIDQTTITTSLKEGVGASRRVSGKNQSLEETVTEWKEGKGFTIKLHNGDKCVFPFSEAAFTYRIDPTGDKQCKLTTTMTYSVRWGALGKLLNSLLFASIVRKNVRDVALSMKKYYETNEPTTMEDLKKLRQIPEERLPQPYQ